MRYLLSHLDAPWFGWFMTAVSAAMLYLYVDDYERNVLEFWAWATMFTAWTCSTIYRTWYRRNE